MLPDGGNRAVGAFRAAGEIPPPPDAAPQIFRENRCCCAFAETAEPRGILRRWRPGSVLRGGFPAWQIVKAACFCRFAHRWVFNRWLETVLQALAPSRRCPCERFRKNLRGRKTSEISGRGFDLATVSGDFLKESSPRGDTAREGRSRPGGLPTRAHFAELLGDLFGSNGLGHGFFFREAGDASLPRFVQGFSGVPCGRPFFSGLAAKEVVYGEF